MKTVLKLAVLLPCLLLAGCPFVWDMSAASWDKARQQCASFGGLVAADEDYGGDGDATVTSLCADKTIVKQYYSSSEMKR